MENTTTTDLSEFGFRELNELSILIKAMVTQGLPRDFNSDGVVPMFNKNSGNVFLTNSEYQVAMMNGNNLESFYSCPECGHEGFLEDMFHLNADNQNQECKEYVKSIQSEEEK